MAPPNIHIFRPASKVFRFIFGKHAKRRLRRKCTSVEGCPQRPPRRTWASLGPCAGFLGARLPLDAGVESAMRFWLSGPRIGWFRPGVSFGPEDFRRRPRPSAAVIVLSSMRIPSSSFTKRSCA